VQSKLLKNYILFASILVLLLNGCSTKEVFEPTVVGDDWDRYESAEGTIVDTSLNVAQLDNEKLITKSTVINLDTNETQRAVSHSGGWLVLATIDGKVSLISEHDTTLQEDFDLKKTIAGASVKDDTLAVIFADNEIALYDIPSKAILFKEQGTKYIAADSRIVNPHFMNGIVLFATLDGKIILVNQKANKRLRTVIVSSEDNFNNIISMNIVDNKIIAATAYKILSMSQKEVRAKYEIRDVAYDEQNIYIATKQGEVISLTPDLQVNLKVKFPFAHFYGIISNEDKLYLLEKEGYLIVVDKKTFQYTIHEVDIDDGFIFIADKLFYVDDEKILTE